MNRWILPFAIVLLGLGLVAAWWFTSGESEPVELRPGTSDSAGVAEAPAAKQLDAAAESESPEPEPVAKRESIPETTSEDELASAIWVEGRVVFPPGTPADEELWVEASGRKFKDRSLHRVRVEPDGSFRVAFSKRTSKGRLKLEGKYLYLESTERFDAEEASGVPQTLEPKLGARMVVRLVYPPGISPPEDVAVLATGTRQSAAGSRRASFPYNRQLKVGEEGEVAFDALPGGYEFTVHCDPSVVVPIRLRGISIEPGKTRVEDFEFEEGVRLSGTVVDGLGQPIVGAKVRTKRPRMVFSHYAMRSETTDDDGAFELVGVTAGRVRLEVTHDEFKEIEWNGGELTDGTVLDTVHISMQAGQVIAGRVQWPDGRPVTKAWIGLAGIEEEDVDDALISFSWDINSSQDTLRAKTDENGEFRFAGLEDPVYYLAAKASPDAEVLGLDESENKRLRRRPEPPWKGHVERVAVGAQSLVVVLGEGTVLTGNVVDDRGQPVEGAYVLAKYVLKESTYTTYGEEVGWKFRNDDGSFRLTGLRPGRWDVSASASRHSPPPKQRIEVGAAGTRVDLVVERNAQVRGIVVDPSGTPVPKAEVDFEPLRQWGSNFFAVGNNASGTRADKNGEFTLKSVPPGGASIAATGQGMARSNPTQVDLAPAEVLEGVRLVLQPGGHLEVLVYEPDGQPGARRTIRLRSRDTSGSSSHATDSQGRLEISNLAPGLYQISLDIDAATAAGLENDDGEIDWAQWRKHNERKEVAIVAGETSQVVLGLPKTPVQVSGRVTARGEPADGRVYFTDRGTSRLGTHPAELDDDGNYSVELPSSSTYSIVVQSRQAGHYATERDIPSKPDVVLDFDLEVADIAGTVVDASGQPIPGLTVKASSAGEDFDTNQGNARTGEDGTFSIGVTPGTYTVTAGGPGSGDGWSRAQVDNVRATAEEGAQGLRIELSRGGDLELVLRRASGSTLRGGTILVRDAQGRLQHAAFQYNRDKDTEPVVRVTGLEPGPVLVVATSGNLASQPTPVEVRVGETQRATLELESGAQLRVELRDAEGKRLEADLHVADASGAEIYDSKRPESVFRRRSSYSISVPPGQFELRAENDRGGSVRETVTVGAEEERRIVLTLP